MSPITRWWWGRRLASPAGFATAVRPSRTGSAPRREKRPGAPAPAAASVPAAVDAWAAARGGSLDPGPRAKTRAPGVSPSMFDTLTQGFRQARNRLAGLTELTESNID